MFVLVLMPALSAENKKQPVDEDEDEEEEEIEEKPNDKDKITTEAAWEMLKKASESYYDIEKQGVTRYACYVKMPEIAKSRDFRNNFILTNVNYELIWEKDKPAQVKARDLPPYFRQEARVEAETYARLMETAYREFIKITNPIQTFFNFLDTLDKDKFEITAAPDGKLTQIEIGPKPPPEEKAEEKGKEPENKPAEQHGPPPEERGKDRDRARIKDMPVDDSFTMVIWLNKNYQIPKFEFANKREKVAATITPAKYKKFWNMGKLDVTKKNPKDEFVERTLINYAYEHPKNIMLPSTITVTKVDKSGKTLERRNEVNPVNINFTQYEVEVNK